MESKIKALVGESSIVLHYHGAAITIQAATDRLLFEEFKELIKANDIDVLRDRFLDVKARIEKYTDKNFYIKDQSLFLKGDNTPIPEALAKRLLALEEAGEDFMPLVRFWKNLKLNPSEDSVKQLYGFIAHNNVPLTDMGHIVTEKGVDQRKGGAVGELVDCRTGTLDNSIGMEVSMDREKVTADPSVTCSTGLHVGAPDYVKQHYGNNIIIQCIVHPRDVVSVPVDYNNTKMRVCRYTVVGYGHNSTYKPVYSLGDFINTPAPEVEEQMEHVSKLEKGDKKSNKDKAKSKKAKSKKATIPKRLFNKYFKRFNKMKAKEVVEQVSKDYNVNLTYSLKSKAAIVKKAAIIAANSEEISKK